MREVERICDQLKRVFEGNAWHGPAVLETLSGVSSEKAAKQPLHAGHSIWEIVLHVAVWESIVRRRIEGEVITGIPPEEDWPPVTATSKEDWEKTLASLQAGHQQLHETIARFDDGRLGEMVPGTDYSFYVMLHGVVHHDLYHAGQIAILKKAA